MAEGNAVGRLKRERGVVRSSATKLMQKIDAELRKEESDPNLLEEYVEQLMMKEQSLTDYDRDIEAGTKDEDLEEVNSTMEYMDSINLRKTRIRRALRTYEEMGSTRYSAHSNMGSQNNSVKLPKLII